MNGFWLCTQVHTHVPQHLHSVRILMNAISLAFRSAFTRIVIALHSHTYSQECYIRCIHVRINMNGCGLAYTYIFTQMQEHVHPFTFTFTFGEDSMLSSAEAIIKFGPMHKNTCIHVQNFAALEHVTQSERKPSQVGRV